MKTTADSTAGAIAGFTLALCLAALMVMAVIKVGLIWFG